VYWTEYVIRHKGAPHLRSAVLDLAWYQYLLLDVIAVLALAVGSVVLIVYMTHREIFNKICGGGGRYKSEDRILRKNKRDKGRFQASYLANFHSSGLLLTVMEFCLQLIRGRVLASASRVV